MAPSSRDKTLLLLLPSFLVVVAYAWWFHLPAQADLESVDKELKLLRTQADPLILQQKAARISQLRQDKDALQARQAELRNEWQALTGSSDDPARRNQRLENLAAIFKQNGLTVVEQAPADGGKEGGPPMALNPVAKRLADGKQAPQLWRFRVLGSFASLQRALQVLAEGEPLVIPLGVSMKEAGLDTAQREWTLVVWL